MKLFEIELHRLFVDKAARRKELIAKLRPPMTHESLGPVHLDSSARYPSDRPTLELADIADEAVDAIIKAVEPLVRTS
jgi:hypothetical protein